MASYVALLRGINVGGRNILPMKDFREILENLGCEDVATYIQSGNAVFHHSGKAMEVSESISDAIETDFSFRPSVMVLTAEEFAATAAVNPFADVAVEAKNAHIWFTSEAITNADKTRLRELATASEEFALTENAFYLHAPDGIGRSKLASNVEKCLGVEATARNWRTTGKIAELIAKLA
jgi:uncharacterized protein (DUF1697 family)